MNLRLKLLGGAFAVAAIVAVVGEIVARAANATVALGASSALVLVAGVVFSLAVTRTPAPSDTSAPPSRPDAQSRSTGSSSQPDARSRPSDASSRAGASSRSDASSRAGALSPKGFVPYDGSSPTKKKATTDRADAQGTATSDEAHSGRAGAGEARSGKPGQTASGETSTDEAHSGRAGTATSARGRNAKASSPSGGDAETAPPSSGKAETTPSSSGKADTSSPSDGKGGTSTPGGGHADTSSRGDGHADTSSRGGGKADTSSPSAGHADTSPQGRGNAKPSSPDKSDISGKSGKAKATTSASASGGNATSPSTDKSVISDKSGGRETGVLNREVGDDKRASGRVLTREYTDSILANAGEGICGVDADGKITFANEAAGRITGLGVDEMLDKDVTDFLPDAKLEENDGLEREVTLERPDATSIRAAYTVSVIRQDDKLFGAVIMLRDVSQQRALERDLRHQALHDALTGLPNRKLFLDRLEHAMTRAREGNESIGVLYLDLDGFKKVNDSLGHNAGDQLLRTTAERLLAVLRPHDTLSRLGGDEFAVLLEGADQAKIETLVQGCLDTLCKPFLIQGREATISASIGVVPEAAGYGDADEVVRNADVAMYAAKGEGKARYAIFESRMHEQLIEKLDREARLREAVHRGELRLHLQPVVRLPSRWLTGVEALVRWQDPERGLQQPGNFIPLAEETGIITEIDRWVLLEACQAIKQWQERSPQTAPAWVSVNLSAANLEEDDLTDRVAYALATSGLSPHCLVLELTETVLMRDIAMTSQRLDELRELGVKIAIDDFGTGYSSLGYLRDIPVDVLKVDRAFIRGLPGNRRQQELVSAVVQLGHTLGLRVVAEGVEAESQLSALASVGCRYAQGYHLGRPEPAETLIERIVAGPTGVEVATTVTDRTP